MLSGCFYLKIEAGPAIAQHVEEGNTTVAVLSLQAAEESNFLRGDHRTRMVRNAAKIAASRVNELPADLLVDALV